ncbi:hypothetical protein KRX57_07080 [Weeksellaceae bacterium TAE3-ERU29]|nr:hypothetical protein [Weeksellaceae bacterium TAE3-ERU29]
MIIVTKLLGKDIMGMALFPFILVKEAYLKTNKRIINHEKIHLRQQIEMLIIPFYIWYGSEFLFRWLKTKNKDMAYRSISFEREAYANEYNLNYLKNRKFWSFLKYL